MFAPPSFKQRINALELPSMANLIQEKIIHKKLVRSNTMSHFEKIG